MTRRHAVWRLLTSACLVLTGCGPQRPGMVRVRGQITFDGQPPPAEGMVFFAPETTAPGRPIRPGRARFGRDGAFVVTSFDEGDGLVPGTYRVQVECWKKVPMMNEPGQSYVADPYEPAAVEVPTDARVVEVPLDVPLAKP